MSVQDFLSWNPGNGRRWQLVDGGPQAMAPANRTHGTLLGELGAVIGNHLLGQSSPCSVVVLPGVVPRVRATYDMRVPGLAVTCSDYEAEEDALTDPVLIAEILIFQIVTVGADLLRCGPDGTWPREPDIITEGDTSSRKATSCWKASGFARRWPTSTGAPA